jgi:hypothetical protein
MRPRQDSPAQLVSGHNGLIKGYLGIKLSPARCVAYLNRILVANLRGMTREQDPIVVIITSCLWIADLQNLGTLGVCCDANGSAKERGR